ncbi:uncharacterized protein Dhpd [Diachasmimorpha longicaudata]|uniref:uncharacterized protein Dhpd n=1 Tax=Diachasmimorpha longicaudata TaxID=58733 RepID=UPI0030B8A0D0
MLKSTKLNNGLYFWIEIILYLPLFQGSHQLVPAASQEGSLHVFKTYSDVAIFHYTVPKEVHRATWQFAAFMDGSNCIPREVNIYLQWGSYPIISVDNASFPTTMNTERNDTIIIKTLTTFEAETTVVMPINSPQPGEWYVGAYMSYWDEKVQQQGLGHKCHYSIGSVAIWQQVNGIQNVPIEQKYMMRTTQPSNYYKIFIPSGTWSFRVTIWGCKFQLRLGNITSDSCIKDVAIQGRALPVIDHTKSSLNLAVNGSYTFEEVTPFEDSYYYILVVSNSIVDFNIKVSVSECPVQITESTLTRQWASSFNTSLEYNSPGFSKNLIPFEDAENLTSDSCARRFQLIRVKQLPTFSGVFLLQGREWLTPWIMLTDASPVIAQFDILPLIDIGGSLTIGIHLEIDSAFMKQTVVVFVCVRRGRVPWRKKGEIFCDDDKMMMRLETNGKHDGNLLIPYPQPDTWYIGLQARCFIDGNPTNCEVGEILVSLDIRTHQCVFPGSHPCGHHGVCEEIHRNFIHFTTCNCFGGYKGWGCTDSTNAYQQPSLVLSSFMLILTDCCDAVVPSIMDTHVFLGPIAHTKDNGELEIFQHGMLLVKAGKIESVGEVQPNTALTVDKVTQLKKGQFLIPGFIDCHIHAVQLPNIGIGYDRPLMEWLEKYTFPLEKKYSDAEFADRVYDSVVKHTLNVGTTTACYFASMNGRTSAILAVKALKHRQRAFVGKVNMNAFRDDGYCETTEESIQATIEFATDVISFSDPLVQPIITPRFALSCDMDLLTKLGELARTEDLHIQTHVSENLSEIELCKKMYPECPNYTSVYDKAGLLTRKTILAHGVHLQDEELEILKERETSIIHCPTSNTCLRSGLCDVRRLRSKGINVGLGTDVAGGNSLSMLDVMRSAIQVSTHLSFDKEEYEPLNYVDVFHMATLGGAKALAIEDQVGNFTPQKQFDALLIDTNISQGSLHDFSEWTVEQQLQRFIHSGDDRHIAQVFVSGYQVK